MPRTIKAKLVIFIQGIKIAMLKHKIKKMEHLSYLDLWERMELRDATALLQKLEQQQEYHNSPMLSLQ